MPDDARYADEAPEGGERKVGGATLAAQYQSDEEEEGMGHEESAQAAIDRQAEAIVLGQMLLNPQKRRALEDSAYNRHTKNDRGLPQWFLDDERKYAQPSGYGMELDGGMLEKAKNGLKDITARSIGKVAEAKARKQRRLNRALTKLKKKANAIASKEDLSEREKAREVEKLYKKKIDKKERKQKKLIIGRRFEAGSGGKTSHGVKMVDSRLKNDVRAKKMADKRANKKGGKGGKGGKAKGGAGGGGGKKSKGGRQKKGANYGRR